MEHFLVNIQFLTNGEVSHKIHSYETKEQAMNAYHATLLYNYKAEEVKKFVCLVMDDNLPLIWESYVKEGDNDGEEE